MYICIRMCQANSPIEVRKLRIMSPLQRSLTAPRRP